MKVFVNGAPQELPEGSTVADLVASAPVAGERGVAVAVDAEVIPRSVWTQTRLVEGQQVELVVAIQGGSA